MKKLILILFISLIPILGFSYNLKEGEQVRSMTTIISLEEILQKKLPAGTLTNLIEKRLRRMVDKVGDTNILDVSISGLGLDAIQIHVIYKSLT